jgi:hypothetical protein
VKRRDLEGLVQAMADGSLDEHGFARLQQELRTSAAARALYRESMTVELLLEELLGGRHPSSGARMEGLLRRRQRRVLGWALTAAAAVLCVAAVVLHRIFVETPDHRIHVAFTPGTAWSGQAADGVLDAGRMMRIQFGLAEVSLPDGVRGVIEGPAAFRIDEPGCLRLFEGRGWFRVEPKGRGFQVVTSQIEVTDLGTEFGVVTRADALDEVHVFEGRVAVGSRFGLKQHREVVAGEAASVSEVGRWIDRQPEPNRFFEELPPSLPGIRFSFDGRLPLRPEGVHPAVSRMKMTRAGGGGPHLVEGIRGNALSIRGRDDVIATDWRGIGGTEPRTMACWIRCEEETADYSPILSWGLGEEKPGRCNLMVAKSPKHGRTVLRFSLGHHVNFSGSTPLEPGKWHHVTAVFRGLHDLSGDMVELYIDGRRERVDPEFSQPPRQDQKIGTIIDSTRSFPLRIGTGPYMGTTNTFRGLIDEVCILPRAVSEQEVPGLMESGGKGN